MSKLPVYMMLEMSWGLVAVLGQVSAGRDLSGALALVSPLSSKGFRLCPQMQTFSKKYRHFSVTHGQCSRLYAV
eukprot:2341712-Amphidinium_carterae.2